MAHTGTLVRSILPAFGAGAIYGAFRNEYSWEEEGIEGLLSSVGFILGCGLGLAILAASIWGATTMIKKTISMALRIRR